MRQSCAASMRLSDVARMHAQLSKVLGSASKSNVSHAMALIKDDRDISDE
jgi:hypothetical protein